MDIRLLYPSARSARYRFLATGLLVVFMATLVMRVDAQQLVPFGDVPVTETFSEAEIATRGQQQGLPLTYTPWRKVCFKAIQEAGSKMVCRTTINGKWDTGQIAIRVDLIEREGDPVARLQIFVPPGSFLQPGIKKSIWLRFGRTTSAHTTFVFEHYRTAIHLPGADRPMPFGLSLAHWKLTLGTALLRGLQETATS